MLIELVDYTPDAEEKIASYAAICYGSKTTSEANERRIKHLLNLGHLATLRFAHATFYIGGISRACSHQLVRAKHLDYLQESQRYLDASDFRFIIPDSVPATERYEWRAVFEDLRCMYKKYRDLGMKKEDARFLLPNATETSLYVTGNFQAWKEWTDLRMEKHAQWEIRQVATEVRRLLQEISPNVFRAD